jgi:tetratricopeptide (TPR) repeat protein
LRIDQHRFGDALWCVEKGLALKPSADIRGRILLTKATVCHQLGRTAWALAALQEAEQCLDAKKESALWLRMRLEQLHLLCEAGRHPEAAALLEGASNLAKTAGTERDKLAVRCLKGRILASLGRETEAIEALQAAREAHLAAELVLEATALGLELAALWTSRGREAEVVELARNLEPLVRDKRLPFTARATLKAFCWAVRKGRLDVERSRTLAVDFRLSGSRITHPYTLPV